MAKYRKKPIVIEAWQWTYQDALDFVIPPAPSGRLRERGFFKQHWELQTIEGWYRLRPGDWIIYGSAGEYYPCKPDIFEATYELLGEAPQNKDI